jgi:hypothetical protein
VARATETSTCPVCGAEFEKSVTTKTCSRSCGSRRSQAIAAGIDIEVPGAVTAWYEEKARAGQEAERARSSSKAEDAEDEDLIADPEPEDDLADLMSEEPV